MSFEEWPEENESISGDYNDPNTWGEQPETEIQTFDLEDELLSYSCTPNKKKDRKWASYCLEDLISTRCIRDAFQKRKDNEIRAILHLEDVQSNGDSSFIEESIWLDDEVCRHSEIKVNRNALKTGFFDIEFMRMETGKPSGIHQSITDNLDLWIFVLPTFENCIKYHSTGYKPYRKDLEHHADKFYFCNPKDLLNAVLKKGENGKNRTQMNNRMRMNYDERNPAGLFQIEIDHDVFQTLPLGWDKYFTTEEPDFFKKVFK